MPNTPSIIGLTLNYRDAVRTYHCVQSLLDNGIQAIVVWDNSADGGQSLSEVQTYWNNDQRVLIIPSLTNLGFAAGVNRGIEQIAKRWPNAWVMLINNDAILRPGALNVLAAALHKHPQTVVAYPSINHAGRIIGTPFYQPHFALLTFDHPLPGSFPFPSGCAQLIAPERTALPLYDEKFFMYGEDTMLGWCLGSKHMVHVPKVLVDHEGNASSGMGSVFYETHMAAAHWILARKIPHHFVGLTIMLIGRAFSLTARALVRSTRYRSSVPLKALVEGWKIAFQRR